MTDRVRPVALITGGARGIGLAVAEKLAHDHHLLIGGRDPERCAEVAASFPSAEPWPVDLGEARAVEAAAQGIERLDVLVHSAGIAGGAPVAEMTRDQWTSMLATNVVAVADLTRLALPALRAARGLVVLIGSGAALRAAPGSSAYSASKAALQAFGDALREEERGAIRVTVLHPGRVDTDMQVRLQQRAGRDYNPDEHLRPESVAAGVRLAVDATPEASVDTLIIRPVVGQLR
ncbi:SDR family oxidoreductase [Ammonicoccus fulvus]|uniref:SDR family oxidoreductase n=1 Tax=Ammonicoccus fulvus TaxID=3138240 RepID=A0ABZ3FPR3_9ACTN